MKEKRVEITKKIKLFWNRHGVVIFHLKYNKIWGQGKFLCLPHPVLSTQKSYFCDNDAIYDVIMQEPVYKWRHNHRHKISKDSFAELPLFKTFSIIFIFRQIGRANFAVRGPSSLSIFKILRCISNYFHRIFQQDLVQAFPVHRPVPICQMEEGHFVAPQKGVSLWLFTLLK